MKSRLVVSILVVVCCVVRSFAAVGVIPNQSLLSDQWHCLFFTHSPLTNPAFMTEEDYATARGAFYLSPNNIANLCELGYVMPIDLRQSTGVTVVGELGEPVRDGYFDPKSKDFVALNTSSNNMGALVLSYAATVWQQLSLGANLKIKNIDNFGGGWLTEFSGDIGLSYHLLRNPLFGNHLLGIVYQNPFSYVLSDNNNANKTIQKGGQQLKLAYHSSYSEEKISFDCQVDLSGIMAKSTGNFQGISSATPAKDLLQEAVFQLLFGYSLFRLIDLKPIVGFSHTVAEKWVVEYWGLGVGMNVIRFGSGRDFAFTYQYLNGRSGGLDAAHSLYVRVGIGKHREEIHDDQLRKTLNLLPNELFSKARLLYYNKKYWESYKVFTAISTDYPDFFRNDEVSYYMGLCLEDLDMRNVAANSFSETKANFPLSKIFPYAQLETMRIAYRQQKFGKVAEQYKEIIAYNEVLASEGYKGMSDSLINHTYYYVGETYIQQGEYQKAIDILSKIPEGHPDFPFAQHSMAIAQILMAPSPSMVVSFLSNSVMANPQTKGEVDIVNRSYLFAGYLYYEIDSLSKAVTTLRKVSKDCRFYNGALLGLGWATIKAHQWNDCKTYGQQIASGDGNALVQAEGLLIKAFGLMNLKEYNKAGTTLDEASRKIESYHVFTNDTLTSVDVEYGVNRQKYDSLGENFVTLARKGESSTILSKIDNMHGTQIQLKDKIDEYVRFVDQYDRIALFNKNLPYLKDDIQYARAKIEMLKTAKETQEDILKSSKKQEVIQEKINREKEELDKLQNTGD